MSIIIKCDICNKVIKPEKETPPDLKSFALEQYGNAVDICDDCFRELIEVIKERRNIAKKTCGMCKYFEVDSNFSTDFCLRHKESTNDYNEICDDFEESKEFKENDIFEE